MRILALDLGKYKTVACEYEAETGRHRFATVLTTPKCTPEEWTVVVDNIAFEK